MYLAEMGVLHELHLPLRIIQLRAGIFSNHEIFFPQLGQWEGVKTIDSPLGILHMQTLKKLPTHSPKRKITAEKNSDDSALKINSKPNIQNSKLHGRTPVLHFWKLYKVFSCNYIKSGSYFKSNFILRSHYSSIESVRAGAVSFEGFKDFYCIGQNFFCCFNV